MRLTESYSTNCKAVGFHTILLIHCLLSSTGLAAFLGACDCAALAFCHIGDPSACASMHSAILLLHFYLSVCMWHCMVLRRNEWIFTRST